MGLWKRVLALALSMCLVLSVAAVTATAEDGPKVSVGDVSVYPGNTASVTLKAEDFAGILTFEIYIYYDPSVFSVSSTTNGGLLSGAMTSVNDDQTGTVTLEAMQLGGITGTGNLLTVHFKVAANCVPGTYPVRMAVGRAYDSNYSAISIGSSNGNITVKQQAATEPFAIAGHANKTTLQRGNILTYKVASTSASRDFASGDFVVEYDHRYFAFDSLELDPALQKSDALYSVNSSILGQVRLTYAAITPVNTTDLFTVRLQVIADVDDTTTVKADATNMYREDLSAYLPGSCANEITLQKAPTVLDHPNVYFETQQMTVGKESTSVFKLEAGTSVAAADFILNYDPAVLQCVSVVVAEEISRSGCMLVLNDNIHNGTIRFSYINQKGYNPEELPLVVITWKPVSSPETHYQLTSGAKGVTNLELKPVTLEYVPDSGCIFNPLTCNGCGNARVTMDMEQVVLRPGVAGIYFKGNLSWDKNDPGIRRCGITVSLENALPVADGSDETCLYTQGGVSALITNVLDADNTDRQNSENLRKTIYARAYAELEDGTYIYSDVVAVNLLQVLAAVDAGFNTLTSAQQEAVTAMYAQFAHILKFWKFPNLSE